MPHTLRLSDTSVQLAATQLVLAAERLAQTHTVVPTVESPGQLHLTTELAQFVRAVDIARRSLVDAAHHSSKQLAALLRSHEELDAFIAAKLSPDFMVPGAAS